MALRLAHVSDLHVSTFGDTFHDRARIVKRSARVADTSASRFEVVWSLAGWRVLRERDKRSPKLSIVDPEGYAHPLPGRGSSALPDPVERAAEKACRLEARRAKTLAEAEPTQGALATMAETTPKNSNVRLLRAAKHVRESDVDYVAITGDLTDDGDGYELISSAFSRYKKEGRLLAIPGNHDLYLFPLAGSARPRHTHESKREAWRTFARELGLELAPCGAWVHEAPAGVFFLGLDTCARPQRRFFRHNGAIGGEQLAFLRDVAKSAGWKGAKHRVVLLHHHVVPLPHGVGRRAPSEIGMRLDDAKAAAEAFNETGVTLVMHGHRHISEERQPAGCRFRLIAAPSLTLGCRSGDGPSFWRVEFGDHVHASRVYVPLTAIEEDEDPGVASTPELPADED